jgi:hypothetical protein
MHDITFTDHTGVNLWRECELRYGMSKVYYQQLLRQLL